MQTLLLLPGLLSDETIWKDAATHVDATDIRIPSFPNCDSIASMAHQVLKVSPAHFAIAGHSMGGRIALEVVRQAPARVLGVALLNTGVHPCRDGEAQSRGALVQLAREQGMTALARAWLPPMMGASPERIAQVLPALTAMVERSTPDEFAAQINALLTRPDALSVLPTINVPTLLLSGRNDRWSPLAQHEDMKLHLSKATLVAIEDAGHMAPIEQPQAVGAALRQWFVGL